MDCLRFSRCLALEHIKGRGCPLATFATLSTTGFSRFSPRPQWENGTKSAQMTPFWRKRYPSYDWTLWVGCCSVSVRVWVPKSRNENLLSLHEIEVINFLSKMYEFIITSPCDFFLCNQLLSRSPICDTVSLVVTCRVLMGCVSPLVPPNCPKR